MFDRPSSSLNRAILVQLDFGLPGLAERLDELRLLARSAGAEILGEVTGPRRAPDPALFAGSGKVDEIAALAASVGADIVIFNHDLSAAQQRNLERILTRRVIDRTALILDIFALRARSHEGKLQVELAQLQHLLTRLVRGWTHLERQKGGIGLRGPGEKQLETDRRLLGNGLPCSRSACASLSVSVRCAGAPASAVPCLPCPWWAIPMLASPHSSTP